MPTSYQQHILNQVDESPAFASLRARPMPPGALARLQGLAGSARALVVARLQQHWKRPVLVVTATAEAADVWMDDFDQFGVEARFHFPMTETLPYEPEEPTMEIVARQYGALHYLARRDRADRTAAAAPPPGPPALLVAPLESLQRKVPGPAAFDSLLFPLAWGDRLDLQAAARRLVDMGYERQAMAEARGEFSLRGNILDVFSPQFENPVRIDLFGDEIESIRFFDLVTQRSLREGEELERAVLLPASLQGVAERLATADPASLVPLTDWLPPDTLVVLDGLEKYDAGLDQFDRIARRRYEETTGAQPPRDTVEFSEPLAARLPRAATFLPPEVFFLDGPGVQAALRPYAQVHLPQLDTHDAAPDAGPDFHFAVQAYDTIPPDLPSYLALIKSRQAQDYSIQIVCDNEGQVTRLEELMRENDIGARKCLPGEPAPFAPRSLLQGFQEVALTVGPMHTGFIFPQARILIITDREMFGRYKRRHVYRKAYKGRAIATPTDIQRGDYVVHLDHGIGRFLGIRHQTIDGRPTELLELEYEAGNKLLVPVEMVGRIQKYSSTEGTVPTLDALGGRRWGKRKSKSQEKIDEMAGELLAIYAKREAARGHAFNPDTVWQTEFEDSFVYEETPDQWRAIDEIKRDMTSPKPMDRLLCGDVGFGKTEVAMRAAFKCVEEKKQVAILVPTTILAQQHYTTFQERFADYPFKIEVISRFRTETEQREVIRKLKTGEADIVIGTHRLLSQDMKFADLGLLIVDEEHRFGVAQKEKIKALRAAVDILTLSATPIPRTLHLALSGLRDMSSITTAPRDRLPVRTSVIRFSPREIEEAVMRELNRGGQIYFVHNRVQTIHQVAKSIQQIIPRARIAIGHGQMHERELEQVMLDFIDRKYDILLATTIIESGLDIPNVNTIIINRADAFGLAQLYQLRGRVGRDVKRAYAYLIVPEGRAVTDTAVKRLRAIEEFTELGMGFQIAMRDLEIRGTGNILGAEQHGAIDGVGFELYCSMLEEAVQRLRGETTALDHPVEIQWDLAALLPPDYVPVESQRVSFYKRCALARQPKDLEDLQEELRDRYGAIPPETRNLMAVSLLRVLARNCGVRAVRGVRKGFHLTPRGHLLDFLGEVLELKARRRDIRSVATDSEGALFLEIRDWKPENGLETVLDILRALGAPPAAPAAAGPSV